MGQMWLPFIDWFVILEVPFKADLTVHVYSVNGHGLGVFVHALRLIRVINFKIKVSFCIDVLGTIFYIIIF